MDKLLCAQLREQLQRRGHETKGNKSELYERPLAVLKGEGLTINDVVKEYEDAEFVAQDLEEKQGISGVGKFHIEDRCLMARDIDTRSVVSVSSRASSRSMLSLKRAEAAANRAALAAKAKKLEEVELIEQEQLKMKQKGDRVKLEAEIIEAERREEVLAAFEEEFETGSIIDFKPKKKLISPQASKSCPDNTHIERSNTNTAEVMKQLATCSLKALMPHREITKFNGDVTAYHTFILAFESIIGSQSVEDGEKLHYLEQYTSGRPNEIVRSCLYMDSDRGYREARKLLEKRYGDPHLVGTAYVEKVLNWKEIGKDDVKGLDEFAVMLTSCRNAVSRVPYGVSELQNPKTMRKIISKLPVHLQDRWRRVVDDIQRKGNRTVSFDDLVAYITDEARIVNDPLFGRHLFISKGSPGKKLIPKTINCNYTTRGLKCWYCEGQHILDKCEKFCNIEHSKKIEFLNNKGLCYQCLRHGHYSKNCKNGKICDVCKRKHPTILHKSDKWNLGERVTSLSQSHNQEQAPNQVMNEIDMCSEVGNGISRNMPGVANKTQIQVDQAVDRIQHQNNGVEMGSFQGQGDSKVGVFSTLGLRNAVGGMTVIPVRVEHNGRCISTLAFLDSGSALSFCSKSLIDRLGLKSELGSSIVLPLSTIHGNRNMESTLVSGLSVKDVNEENIVQLPTVCVVNKIPVERNDALGPTDLLKWEHLRNLPIYDLQGEVELMIGSNVPRAMEPLEVVSAPQDSDPYAVRTRLGWMVCGLIPKPVGCFKTNRVGVKSNQELEKVLHDYYNRDFQVLSSREEISTDDQKWLKFVSEGCSKVEGKYQIPLPLKIGDTVIPDSRPTAVNRLKSLKKKLSKDEKMRKEYSKFMQEMLDKNYAEAVVVCDDDQHTWYIPHFGVRHPEKPEKLRIVFDCAAKSIGTSINDLIMPGPDLTNLLLDVLLRFRMGKYACTGDIEAMFYQVKVPINDRDYLRFFWWDNGDLDTQPKVYRMTVHLFGACSSPSVANFALKQTALDGVDTFSESACNVVDQNFYVDDCLISEDDLQALIKVTKEVKDLCKSGGFNLTKFVSPHRDFAKHFPDDFSVGIEKVSDSGEHSVQKKVLGVIWDLKEDALCISMKAGSVPKNKRQLLSSIASIFDPLGIVSPLVLEGRLLLQEACRLNLDWDDNFEGNLKIGVEMWIAKQEKCGSVSVSRCYKPLFMRDITVWELHIFSDASQKGYGVVVYLRLKDLAGHIWCSFVIGRARVGPLKSISIPRLELTAATFAIRLRQAVTSALSVEFNRVVMWTDSTVVLRYIRNDSLKLQTFVANRVAIIKDGSEVKDWRFVDGDLNPADDASRARQTDRWCEGPGFLLRDEEHWPVDPLDLSCTDITGLEVKKPLKVETVSLTPPCSKLISHFSSWQKLVRIVAIFRKFGEYLQHKIGLKPGFERALTVECLEEAELRIIAHVQGIHFADEMNCLKAVKDMKVHSSIRNLSPILVSGVIRVGGRIKHSQIAFEEKHPIILPYRSHLTDLIIMFYHQKVGHMGRASVLGNIREKYWIVKGNAAVRRVVRFCVICRKAKGPRMEQRMADLPEDRVMSNVPPFYNTGLDCFGPFYVKRGRSQIKRYGVLFTCLSIRAIHLEVATDLSTDAFINALRRFLARRGQVHNIRCDNGTNFVGASKDITAGICGKTVHQELLKYNINWVFNPPNASHFGGVWERMVRTVRGVLEVTLGESSTQ